MHRNGIRRLARLIFLLATPMGGGHVWAQSETAAEPVTSEPAAAAAKSGAESAEAAATVEANAAPTTNAAIKREFGLRPRLELFVPSIRKLQSEVQRSHSGVFFSQLRNMLREIAGSTAEGVDPEQADAVLARIAGWPDAQIGALTFAPDREGRVRWAIRVNWPLADLAQRCREILDTAAARELFEGLRLDPAEGERFELHLGDDTLAYLLPDDTNGAFVASHDDLPLGAPVFSGSEETNEGGDPLVVCRQNLQGTERDSGATVFSSFNVVTDVVYAGRVDEEGSWHESIVVHWPPISGMGVKALFGRVKKSFFVPRKALGAMVFKTMMAPGMLEGMVGFGPQITMAPGGDLEVFGEQALGPIAASTGSELCVTVLPGNGFLPVPDFVAQLRAKRPDALMDNIRNAASKLNDEYLSREQRPPWHFHVIRDRQVVWSEGANRYPGMMMPMVLRPVLFTTTDADAEGKERDYLVVGWTSTSPERFVRRWLDLPRRDAEMLHLPTQSKTNGQLWVNWKQVYEFLSPYANLAIDTFVQDSLLPPYDKVEDKLTDASLTMKASFTGLKAGYTGPLPIGSLVLPSMVATSLAPDESGGSDLARERLAIQRLKVFYHHAKLFKNDIGRWPAELAELDGYIDFNGHPELLHLQLSSRKGWANMFDGIFGDDDKEKEEEDADVLEDEAEVVIDDKLFVIEWNSDHWRLGLAEGTLEHLKTLYIDEDGRIHREEKPAKSKDEDKQAAGERGIMPDARTIAEHAVLNVQRHYGPHERQN